MRQIEKINILVAFFICVLVNISLLGESQAKMGSMPAGIKLQTKAIEKLYWYSGLNTRYQDVESALSRQKNLDPMALKPSQMEFAKNLMRNGRGPSLVGAALKKNFISRFDQGYVEASIKWFKSSAGQKILKAERQGNSPDLKKEREKFVHQIMIQPPNESRSLTVEKIIAQEALPDNINSLFIAYVESMFPFNETLQGKRLVKVMRKLKDSKKELILEQVRLQRLFDLRELKEKDLKAYIRFLESPAGQWFKFSELEGFENGIQKTMTRVHKVQRQLLIEIDKGGPEYPLLRELAPPGQRYMLVRLRDPFKPLFTDEGPVQTEEPVSRAENRRFGGELEDIPPIALYVMSKIEKKRPALFKKMKFYERLFNNREHLKEMDEDEYADAVEGYRVVLELASELKVSKSSLQADYENLKLTGVISKNTKSLALIETPDSKGHVVAEGDLIGPSFGAVDEVQPEKIIVIEKSRDYLGNILTRQRTIEFAQKI